MNASVPNLSAAPAISVVSPVYGNATLVEHLVLRIETALSVVTDSYEIVLVDDGSPDPSWSEIRRLCASHPRLIGMRLSRNFGQHHAISAGLRLTRGRRIVVMDCDLQDRPEEIPRLLAHADQGFEVVVARRVDRQDPALKRWASRAFYRLLSYLTGIAHDPAVANFGVYDRRVIDVINTMPEPIRYFPTMVRWAGFRTAALEVRHDARSQGRSGYSLAKLLRLASDIILTSSEKPLRLMVKAGFTISAIGLGVASYTLVLAVRGQFHVLGYASIIISIWTLAGLIIFLLGLVGLYVGKIFECVKQRPLFVISEVLNRPNA
ncbi:MAG: glycosyltransferase [Gammaproteobacteria bacterium]|nr:glycosyltransferase [Gammaproteobacteria bacterium]